MVKNKGKCLRECSLLASSRSGQGGLNAAILVAIIAGLIILYIVFLPTSEREKIIEQKSGQTSSGEDGNVLLKASPGLLSAADSMEDEKNIPNIFLVETTNAQELETINPFIVRNGWFDKTAKKIDFSLDDPENIDNVVVTFTTKKRSGILTIKLNNAVIFENELDNDAIEPVKLSKNLLQKANSLEFSVSSVGARFWTTNEYSFENVKIIGDITDTSKQQSTNIFTLSESEFSSMEKANLQFIPYCDDVNELGALGIFVNNKKLYSSVPVCGNAYRQSIPKSALNEGENNIVFKTGKGSYSVEQIVISLDFKGSAVKTYYFEIDDSEFNRIKDGDVDAEITLKFVDDKNRKIAKLDVNGHAETIDTDKTTFSKIITSKVSSGNNFVRIEPMDDIEVVELRVELV